MMSKIGQSSEGTDKSDNSKAAHAKNQNVKAMAMRISRVKISLVGKSQMMTGMPKVTTILIQKLRSYFTFSASVVPMLDTSLIDYKKWHCLPLETSRQCPVPVSYTHLDVYKRQI